jgi:3'-phosphoadenosine 5'-phosphosulfate sulfotransferase (PAPS reductase)/FAD synthetase
MLLPLSKYDKIIISTSGGKDSLVLILWSIQEEINLDKVELWHQCIDGRGETKTEFFDWPSTEPYVKAIANHFGIKYGWQWRENGFYREMFRKNQKTGAVYYEHNNIVHKLETSNRAKIGTRRKFPAKSANLNQRWCSAYLKIDVAARVLNNREDLKDKKILFLTGERREESPARSKYKKFELHRCNTKSRLVHHFRPVIDYTEYDIWRHIRSFEIMPHPVYHLGFPRLSCRSCIFFTPDHWATLDQISPEVTKRLIEIEKDLDFTLDNKLSLSEMIVLGQSAIKYQEHKYLNYINRALSVEEFDSVYMSRINWRTPLGMNGKGGGAI